MLKKPILLNGTVYISLASPEALAVRSLNQVVSNVVRVV